MFVPCKFRATNSLNVVCSNPTVVRLLSTASGNGSNFGFPDKSSDRSSARNAASSGHDTRQRSTFAKSSNAVFAGRTVGKFGPSPVASVQSTDTRVSDVLYGLQSHTELALHADNPRPFESSISLSLDVAGRPPGTRSLRNPLHSEPRITLPVTTEPTAVSFDHIP